MSDFTQLGAGGTRHESWDTASSTLPLSAVGGAVDTKGAYVALKASTSFDYESISIEWFNFHTASFLFDIAIGSAGNMTDRIHPSPSIAR